MRLSDVMGLTVVDADGHRLGRVDDVKLVQDGPYIEGFGAALRVDGLLVGAGRLAVRLGYQRHSVKGPVLLKAIFAAIERRGRFVRWADVASVDGGRVVLRGRADDVPTLAEAYGA